jgi:transposase-like protein
MLINIYVIFVNFKGKPTKCNDDSEKVVVNESLPLKKLEPKDLKCPHCSMSYAHKKSLARHIESHSGTKYTCKLCHQSFSRKDHLHRHAEQHSGRFKSFRCMQCNKIFGNELTLRSHVIATSHKTTLHGKEYDPNKRVKRVAARAAQRIIDQIKTDLSLDEFEENERERERDKDFVEGKAEFSVTKNEHSVTISSSL